MKSHVAVIPFSLSIGPTAAALNLLAEGKCSLFFESQTGKGRWSILLLKPVEWLEERAGTFLLQPGEVPLQGDPLDWITDTRDGEYLFFPEEYRELPFLGGLAGFLGFEFGSYLDSFSVAPRRDHTPGAFVGRYEEGLIFDHHQNQWFSFAPGEQIAQELIELLKTSSSKWKQVKGQESRLPGKSGRRLELDPTAEQYEARAQEGIDSIYRGEFFEVNYTERFFGNWSGSREMLYKELRRLAPGDYGGFIALDDVFVASISPEQFLLIDVEGHVTTRPIKGTRPRSNEKAADEANGKSLLESKKDRAENVMIVDLMRNDLTRFSLPGSVQVRELCALYSYASVHHLVSTVESQLDPGVEPVEAFLSAFPAGSITGAPKLRSMEWIFSHEGTPRGPYTGSMFYASDHGRLDSNVLIRTATLQGEVLSYGAGGAVVADSDPESEFTEAIWKARPFFDLLREGE